MSQEESIIAATYTNVAFTDFLTNIKVCCTKEQFINVPVFTHAAITDIQTDITGTLINILTDHKVCYTREEFVNYSVKPNIAMTDIKTIAKLVSIIIPTGNEEELVSVPVASTQLTEIQATPTNRRTLR